MKKCNVAGYALVIALVGAIEAAGTIVSGPVNNPANGHNYYLLSKSTWTSSEAEAIALGGHLVTINDLGENQFLVFTFILNGHDTDPLWIGVNDAVSEGTYVWADGEPLSFTSWHPGEPNNYPEVPGGEDYGTINWHYSGGYTTIAHGTWNDAPNAGTHIWAPGTNGPYYGIAEAAAVPEAPVLVVWSLVAVIATAGSTAKWYFRRRVSET
jgi:Lectin C-type domain